jgi:ATP-dependent RNA helicase DDX31/DBP7
MGGEQKKKEKSRLRKGINVLIGTPGRMLDHMHNTKCLDLGRVRWLVLDESDRLLDHGFTDTLTQIFDALSHAPKKSRKHSRCTVLLSATLTDDVTSLARASLRNPIRIDTTGMDGALAPNPVTEMQPVKIDVEEEAEPAGDTLQ